MGGREAERGVSGLAKSRVLRIGRGLARTVVEDIPFLWAYLGDSEAGHTFGFVLRCRPTSRRFAISA